MVRRYFCYQIFIHFAGLRHRVLLLLEKRLLQIDRDQVSKFAGIGLEYVATLFKGHSDQSDVP